MGAMGKVQILLAKGEVKLFGQDKMVTAIYNNMEKQNEKYIAKMLKGGVLPTAGGILAEYKADPDYMDFYASIGITEDDIRSLAMRSLKHARKKVRH